MMMFNQRDELGFIILMMLVIILAVLIRNFIKSKKKQMLLLQEARRNQAQPDQTSIYNISGRIQGQHPAQYPDAYLSVEHITIANELNKPPKYDDAPPSYEEAIKLAMAQSNSMQTFHAESVQDNGPSQPQTSTSTTTARPEILPAVHNPTRVTE